MLSGAGKVAQQPMTQQVQVQIPAGHIPGMQFAVMVGQQQYVGEKRNDQRVA